MGHIVAPVGVIIGGFAFIYDLRESVAIQSFQLGTVEARLERVVARSDDQFGEIMSHLIRLEEKLDAIVFPNPRIQKAR